MLLDYTDKVSAGFDFTNSGPLFLCKCQDDFLVLSDFIPKDAIQDCHEVHIELEISGQLRQSDKTGNMLFKIYEQFNYMSSHGMRFIPGDLLCSGTPEGNSFVKAGDVLTARLWKDSSKSKQLAEIQ